MRVTLVAVERARTRSSLSLSLSTTTKMLARQLCLRRARQAQLDLPVAASAARRATTVAVPEDGASDPNAYCRDFVQKRDYEAYLVSQFYPQEYRNTFYALRAFYVSSSREPSTCIRSQISPSSVPQVELATVQETVSNPIIGNMRMQFWKDALKSFSDVRALSQSLCLSLLTAVIP